MTLSLTVKNVLLSVKIHPNAGLNVIMLSAIIPSVIMLSVIRLTAVIPSVIRLSVAAPEYRLIS